MVWGFLHHHQEDLVANAFFVASLALDSYSKISFVIEGILGTLRNGVCKKSGDCSYRGNVIMRNFMVG